jgi:hypothetical protein
VPRTLTVQGFGHIVTLPDLSYSGKWDVKFTSTINSAYPDADYPDRLGPSGKHFLTLLHNLMDYRIYSHNSRHRIIHAQWMAEGGHSLTPTGKIRRPSIELMCSWTVRAWDMVDQPVIVTSFLKTGISNALDGSEDDALWQTEENVDEASESEEDYSSEEESNDA